MKGPIVGASNSGKETLAAANDDESSPVADSQGMFALIPRAHYGASDLKAAVEGPGGDDQIG
jgi:hypothetical protein